MVPDHIPRPDYADHAEGFPISEQRMKGNTYVRQLDAEEIEGKRNRKCLFNSSPLGIIKENVPH